MHFTEVIRTFAVKMAGLYIHIPFCSSRCIYCGFFSTTLMEKRQQYVDAICREMELRGGESELKGEPVATIYLGGGTPSLLNAEQLRQLFRYIYIMYNVSGKAEVTIECNPDDVTPSFAELLSELPVNRVSMGAQTFSDERLRFLKRRHQSSQVHMAVKRLRDAGINNISIDLIYGFPNETMDEWQADIDKALDLNVEHLSAYSLSFEEGTELYQMLKTGRVGELDEEIQRSMYYRLIDALQNAGYEHYEISNFARHGFRSRHNSNYWNHTPYIGLGAGAHSLIVKEQMVRRWNVSNLQQYFQGINEGVLAYEEESLDEATLYNDTIMTCLRTCEGLDVTQLPPKQHNYCMRQARKYIDAGWLCLNKNRLVLTRSGLFVSNMIMSDLMDEV